MSSTGLQFLPAGYVFEISCLLVQVYTSQLHTASVNSLSFAPHEVGLILASASSDGSIGIISMTEDSQFQEERVWLQS